MRTIFGHWKYILKNLWYVMPFAIIPAALLAFSFDYEAVSYVMHAFFTGGLHDIDFFWLLRAFSLVRVDSWQGALLTVATAVLCCVCFALMLVFVEKHMRIGKRTLSGLWRQFKWMILPVTCMALVYAALCEVWGAVVAALLFVVCRLRSTVVFYLLFLFVFCSFVFLLTYLVTLLYLFLPCKQVTGFRTYDAFFYSYRLMAGVRGKLLVSLLLSFGGSILLLSALSLLPQSVFTIGSFVLCVFLFMSFGVRMETVYFETDKLDREDRLKSYREL